MKPVGAATPTAAAHPGPAHATKNDAMAAAKQLEAFFMRQVLAEARPQGGGALDGGFAGDTFKQMLDEAIADKMSGAGGVGLAQMFAKQLAKQDEVAAPAAPPIPHTATAATTPSAAPALTEPLPEGIPHFIMPVAGRPSSGYGIRVDPIRGTQANHPGFDLAAVTGTEVAAAAAGTVVQAGPAGTYGNLVTLRHQNGFETRYAHLSAVDVRVGDVVDAGQDIGKVGTTGYSTGPHLHFEVRHDGKTIDPAPLLPLHSSPARTTR